jgi:hypothetical protein
MSASRRVPSEPKVRIHFASANQSRLSRVLPRNDSDRTDTRVLRSPSEPENGGVLVGIAKFGEVSRLAKIAVDFGLSGSSCQLDTVWLLANTI